MTTRTTSRMAAFTHPFSLSGIDGVLPAGEYEIKTDEESIDSLSFLAFRRVATLFGINRSGEMQWHSIDPADLDAALFIEAGAADAPPDASDRNAA